MRQDPVAIFEGTGAMFTHTRQVPVNPDPQAPQLDAHDVWLGLMMKANNALPFVPQLTKCDVIESGADWLIRDVELKGEMMREKVTFSPETSVRFNRLSGPEPGEITNVIETDEEGNLALRFSFELSRVGLEDGSQAEREHFAPMEPAYHSAVESTLAAMRRVVEERGREGLQP